MEHGGDKAKERNKNFFSNYTEAKGEDIVNATKQPLSEFSWHRQC